MIGGQTHLQVRVEVCLNETWGMVWQNINAGITCTQGT